LGSDKKNIKGAPDMVVEIISPSSAQVDRVLKHRRYMEAGVREYWIIDPPRRIVEVYISENGTYYAESYGKKDIVPVHILPDLKIDMAELFSYVEGEEEEDF
jgi:Uma2 family endonuclease